MRLLKPGETQPPENHYYSRKYDEFSEHERALILEMAQGAGRQIAQMSKIEIIETIERFGNMRTYCPDPENFPSNVVDVFEGSPTVPAYLMFERLEQEFQRWLDNKQENTP